MCVKLVTVCGLVEDVPNLRFDLGVERIVISLQDLVRERTVLLMEHGHKFRGRTQFIPNTSSYREKCCKKELRDETVLNHPGFNPS